MQANTIGLGADGSTIVANGRHGVVLYNGTNNTQVGGSAAGEHNVISANTTHGVVIDGNGNAATANNTFEGNRIGTDASGFLGRGNGGAGFYLFSGANNTIIGTAGAGNVIADNGTDGIYMQSAGTTDNVIQGNYIGTTITGDAPLGNGDRGIQLESGADNTIIGGSTAGEGNVIAASGNDGIIISDGAIPGTGVTGTIIEGNNIGVGADDTTPLGNGTNGVRITTESGHRIGGVTANSGNLIAHNTSDGVMLQNTSAINNAILGNDIHSNGQTGIDLGNDGVTTNSNADVWVNHPVITSAPNPAARSPSTSTSTCPPATTASSCSRTPAAPTPPPTARASSGSTPTTSPLIRVALRPTAPPPRAPSATSSPPPQPKPSRHHSAARPSSHWRSRCRQRTPRPPRTPEARTPSPRARISCSTVPDPRTRTPIP